ncbi:hypothetical protein ACQKGC_04320 [Allorhizobium pseudoryzae]|jgi:hypothetical protein|uniref:hypothetical protein n=1 Tax=Allorhizobium pseudoryzae TaxID=379684 RepID=UPI0013EBECF2|nr:hypothetical protein [Allorhizobium pseudoryzae]
MNAAYNVTDMTAAQVDRAFPLVNAIDAVSDLSDWRQICQRIIASRSQGVANEWLLVCANAFGYLKGLCLARISHTETGSILDVPLYVVATVVDEEGVQSALQARLQMLAATLGAAVSPLPA